MQIPSLRFDRSVGFVVFAFSLGLLLYELCLTRVLSVFFYYHTAFLAVSLAMLGVGAGGVWVYLFAGRFRKGIEGWMFGTALSVTLLPLLFASLRFDHKLLDQLWKGPFLWIFLAVALGCLLPFLCGGVVWAWWFRAYREQAAKLYGWDLVGAAVGALCLVPVMESFGGPAAMLACGTLLLLATAWSAWNNQRNGWGRVAFGVALVVWIGVGIQLRYDPLAIQIDMSPTKTKTTRVLFKKWNAFSRVVLLSQQDWYRGMSAQRRTFWKGRLPKEREALIDINAFAPLVQFDGDLKKVRFLQDLVSNMGHHLLPKGQDVAIIGPGGGKDVLGALTFAPRRVVGIEINPILVHDIVRGHSRRFTGDLYRHPKVEIRLGDGRSVLRHSGRDRFGILIANSVATWAAHSSGAMNLAEHSLYTKEACGLYLDRLQKHGILSVSLWDLHRHALPLRWVATCTEAAKKRGIKSLRDHLVVVGNLWDTQSWFTTVMISRRPITTQQEQTLHNVADKLGFTVFYSPRSKHNDKEFRGYFANPKAFAASFPFTISAATDDQPFFLYTARWADALAFWKRGLWEENAALVNLLLSLFLVCFLLVVIVGGPLVWRALTRSDVVALRGADILYFLAIGLGFMFVEIPLIQRFTLFLGHPTYALTVVLASILLYSGMGSLLVGSWGRTKALGRWSTLLLCLCGLLVGLLFLLPLTLQEAAGYPLFMRIAVALVLLLPFGLFMGMPLPLAMLHLGVERPSAIPWAWGINGASSVVASVASLWLAALWGFQNVFLLAIACYALAWLAARRLAPK